MRVIIFYVTGFCFFTFGDNCGPSEYESGHGECCPMCSMGLMVLEDCTNDSSTSCKPCIPGTFMSEPSGLHKCFECNHCDESQGLYIQSKCTTTKDTICDVLEGYYCEVYSNSQCRHAKKHSVCKPGQEKKKEGTKTSDTVCENCTYGFYSPSGLNCNKWTDCAARNEIKTEDGSPEKDVTCVAKRERYGLLALLTTPVIFAAVLAELYRRSCSKVQKVNNGNKGCRLDIQPPIEETDSGKKTSGQTLDVVVTSTSRL
ncbi:tumor necrosis factor receptor superfamily member 14-like isoform X2 [Megalobrama amblycephala]|uniref:tumor necrosis factor receptor superfamily member 14-like isoform X2 n=1 Tax=Megalobrama amblycephala TaxID=75352 RepID=UPI002013C644|nr:tumor necrosis factor receptor superfamily member 14-like isoform X2 [Megalobrama amblycephala]